MCVNKGVVQIVRHRLLAVCIQCVCSQMSCTRVLDISYWPCVSGVCVYRGVVVRSVRHRLLAVCIHAVFVFTEELLYTHVAHWWSVESRYVCYATFNDTDVPLFSFPLYGPPENVYTSTVSIAYPKVTASTAPTASAVSSSIHIKLTVTPRID